MSAPEPTDRPERVVRRTIQSVVVTGNEPNGGVTIVADAGQDGPERYLMIEVPTSSINGLAHALLQSVAESDAPPAPRAPEPDAGDEALVRELARAVADQWRYKDRRGRRSGHRGVSTRHKTPPAPPSSPASPHSAPRWRSGRATSPRCEEYVETWRRDIGAHEAHHDDGPNGDREDLGEAIDRVVAERDAARAEAATLRSALDAAKAEREEAVALAELACCINDDDSPSTETWTRLDVAVQAYMAKRGVSNG